MQHCYTEARYVKQLAAYPRLVRQIVNLAQLTLTGASVLAPEGFL